MPDKRIRTTLVIQGDSKQAVKQLKLTEAQLERLTASQRTANRTMSNYDGQVGNVVRNLGRYAVVAGTIAAAATAALVKQQFSHIDTLAKTSDKLGLTTERLAGLRLAAELTGVEQRKLYLGLQRLVRRLDEVATGTGEAKDAVRELGLDAKELSKQSIDKIFLAIAGAMTKVDQQGRRVRLTMKFVDSEGVALVNTLGLGEQGLLEIFQLADDLGIAISRFDAAKIEAANDAVTLAKAAVSGLTQQIAIELAPVVKDVADGFTEWVVEANAGVGVGAKLAAQIDLIGDAALAVTAIMIARHVPALLKVGYEYLALTYLSLKFRDASLVTAGAVNVLNRSLMFIGGPAGAIFLVVAGLGYMASGMEDAGEEADRLAAKALNMADQFDKMGQAELEARRIQTVSAIQAKQRQLERLEQQQRMIGRTAVNRFSLPDGANYTDAQRQQHADLEVQIADIGREVTELTTSLGGLDESLENVGQSMADTGDETGVATKRVAELLVQLEREHSLIGLSNRERAIAIAQHRANGEATAEEMEKIAALAGAIYDAAEAKKKLAAASKTTTKAVQDAAKEADPFAKAWETATERIDAAFAEAWKGAFDSFDSFSSSLKEAFKTLIAELIHTATTKKIIFNIGSGLGIGGGGSGGAAGGAGSTLSAAGGLANIAGLVGGGYAGLYSGLAGATSTFGVNAYSQLAGVRAAHIGTMTGTQLAADIGLNAGAGLLGGYAGNAVGGALFDRESATGGLLTAAGGILGSVVPGLGTAVGAFIGGVLDNALGGSKFSGKRVKLGVATGGRWDPESGYDYSRTAASGLELGLITKRTNNLGLTDDDESKFLDTFLNIDNTLTTLAASAGYRVNLAGTSLTNPTQYRYDGGAAPTDFFGSLAKGELKADNLKAAPAEFIKAWIDATADVFDEAIAEQLQALDGTADEILAAYSEIFVFENARKSIGNLFETEAAKINTAATDTAKAFHQLTGTALPATRAGLQEYIAALDLQDDANREIIKGIVAMTPELQKWIELSDAIGAAMVEQNRKARENLAALTTQLDGARSELVRLRRSDFANALADIRVNMEAAEAAARALGATEAQLADIHRLAAEQARRAILSQHTSIMGIIDSLYGSDLNDRIAAQQAHVDDLSKRQRELYDMEMKRYNNAIEANKTINDYLNSLALGDLTTLSPQQQLQEARKQFDAAIQAGGATDAAAAAQTYLQSARDFYASGGGYKAIFRTVNTALSELLTAPGTAPVLGTVNTGRLSALQRQADTEAQERAAQERNIQFASLLQAFREYGQATGQNFYELFALFGLTDNTNRFLADYRNLNAGQGGGTSSALARVASTLPGGGAANDEHLALLKTSDSHLSGIESTITTMNRELIKFREESWRMHHLNNENRTWNRRYVTGALNSIDRNLDNGVGIYLARAS